MVIADNIDMESSLSDVPVTVFASSMGITGLGLAWRFSDYIFPGSNEFGNVLISLGGILFVALLSIYALKLLRYPLVVWNELNHRTLAGCFGQITVNMLLLAEGALPFSTSLAFFLLATGSALNLLLTAYLFRNWLGGGYAVEHLSPAWLVPGIANMMVPLIGMPLGVVEFSWFFFVLGFGSWIVIQPALLYRLVVVSPPPLAALPVVTVMIAPPAVAFLSIGLLCGGLGDFFLGPFNKMLYYVSIVMALAVLVLFPKLICAPFALSWWAYTMPVAALSIAASVYHHEMGLGSTWGMATMILFVVTVTTFIVALRTLVELALGRLFQPG